MKRINSSAPMSNPQIDTRISKQRVAAQRAAAGQKSKAITAFAEGIILLSIGGMLFWQCWVNWSQARSLASSASSGERVLAVELMYFAKNFLIATLCFVLVGSILEIVASRRWRRWVKASRSVENQCVKCGYDRRATPLDSPCPECGFSGSPVSGAEKAQ
jgi:hypothetical protein